MMRNQVDQPKALGLTIRSRRKALRMTQEDLAQLAGCHIDFVSDLERGKATVRMDKVLEVLSALGLKLVVEG